MPAIFAAMRPEKSKRIDTNPAQGGLASLGQALSGLSLPDLPAGPANPPPAASTPAAVPVKAKSKGRVVLRREKAHRGGKTVIVIHDFPPAVNLKALEEIARALRGALGCGGTVRDRQVEIQGDQPGKIRAYLEEQGFQVAGVS